jgi:hypothetical protein
LPNAKENSPFPLYNYFAQHKMLLYDIGPVHDIYCCRVSFTAAKADGDSVAIVTQIRATIMLLMRTEGN